MWDLPGPGIEPVSPALAGGFLTTAPQGKSSSIESSFKFVMKVLNLEYVFTGHFYLFFYDSLTISILLILKIGL